MDSRLWLTSDGKRIKSMLKLTTMSGKVRIIKRTYLSRLFKNSKLFKNGK